jgi:hypothetical protein
MVGTIGVQTVIILGAVAVLARFVPVDPAYRRLFD